jgi:hypothetical protein
MTERRDGQDTSERMKQLRLGSIFEPPTNLDPQGLFFAPLQGTVFSVHGRQRVGDTYEQSPGSFLYRLGGPIVARLIEPNPFTNVEIRLGHMGLIPLTDGETTLVLGTEGNAIDTYPDDHSDLRIVVENSRATLFAYGRRFIQLDESSRLPVVVGRDTRDFQSETFESLLLPEVLRERLISRIHLTAAIVSEGLDNPHLAIEPLSIQGTYIKKIVRNTSK